MNADTLLYKLRRFLLVLSGVLFGGSALELALLKHTKSLVQLVPFVLCALGILALLVALRRPQLHILLILRVCMGVIALGSLLGVYEHIVNNLEFQLELHPGASLVNTVVGALSGASPVLAPGMLGLAAVLAVTATYYHPALAGQR